MRASPFPPHWVCADDGRLVQKSALIDFKRWFNESFGGEEETQVYMVLDGMFLVEVDGGEVAEIGPGAVVGERAALRAGIRTATLRATTRPASQRPPRSCWISSSSTRWPKRTAAKKHPPEPGIRQMASVRALTGYRRLQRSAV